MGGATHVSGWEALDSSVFQGLSLLCLALTTVILACSSSPAKDDSGDATTDLRRGEVSDLDRSGETDISSVEAQIPDEAGLHDAADSGSEVALPSCPGGESWLWGRCRPESDRAALLATHWPSGPVCTVRPDQSVVCWGRYENWSDCSEGLGSYPTVLGSVPGTDGAAVVAGQCALTYEGGVHCWWPTVAPGSCELGLESPGYPGPIAATPIAVGEVIPSRLCLGGSSAAWAPLCLLDQAGKMYCTENVFSTEETDEYGLLHRVDGTEALTSCTGGWKGGCSLNQDGSVHCWHKLMSGSEGHLAMADAYTVAVPEPLVGLEKPPGPARSYIGVGASGKRYLWREMPAGEEGSQALVYAVALELPASVTQVSETGNSVCFVSAEGAVFCSVDEPPADIGQDTPPVALAYEQVLGISDAVAVDGGIEAGCAVQRDGAVLCWRIPPCVCDSLGPAFAHYQPVPQKVQVAEAVAGGAGGAKAGCAIPLVGDSPLCWGKQNDGVLGPAVPEHDTVWQPLTAFEPPWTGAAQSVHGTHAQIQGKNRFCVSTDDGEVWCWGNNGTGALGKSSSEPYSASPVKLQLGAAVSWIAMGEAVTCAATTDGVVHCFGKLPEWMNASPEEGLAGMAVPEFQGAEGLAIGSAHICFWMEAEGVYCVGDNEYGGLGPGSPEYTAIPTKIEGVQHPIQVEAGEFATYAVTASGEVVMWGMPICWTSGLGFHGNALIGPTLLTIPEPMEQVAPLWTGGCARAKSGNVYCWGLNIMGEAGDPSMRPVLLPRKVPLERTVVSIKAGSQHMLALDEQGDLWAWGRADFGQLGVGDLTPPEDPVMVLPPMDAE